MPTDQATRHHLIPVIRATRTCADRRSTRGYVAERRATAGLRSTLICGVVAACLPNEILVTGPLREP